ncbi:unnamed protein product [Urochloa humidicola]
MALSCMLHVPELDRTTSCEFRDLPGCVPLHGADLLDPIQDRGDPAYHLMVEFGNKHRLADGFIVNTFDAIGRDTLVAFKELSDKGVYPLAYAVGPFVRSVLRRQRRRRRRRQARMPTVAGQGAKHGCLQWPSVCRC